MRTASHSNKTREGMFIPQKTPRAPTTHNNIKLAYNSSSHTHPLPTLPTKRRTQIDFPVQIKQHFAVTPSGRSIIRDKIQFPRGN